MTTTVLPRRARQVPPGADTLANAPVAGGLTSNGGPGAALFLMANSHVDHDWEFPLHRHRALGASEPRGSAADELRIRHLPYRTRNRRHPRIPDPIRSRLRHHDQRSTRIHRLPREHLHPPAARGRHHHRPRRSRSTDQRPHRRTRRPTRGAKGWRAGNTSDKPGPVHPYLHDHR